MVAAIRQAERAKQKGDYAIGAVLVRGNTIIAAANNRSKVDENPIGHAELLAILRGSRILKHRHLTDCVLYTTHEPCPMCASVAVWARLKGIVYGSRISDMRNHRLSHGNRDHLWRTIEISCAEVIRKSTEEIPLAKNFMRKECIKLFHS